MRSFTSRAAILGLFVGAVVVSSGCEAKKATEYVAGISTQIAVPRDLKAVRVEVTVGGFSTFCQAYKVYDGKVQLPRSLGAFPSNESALKTNLPITYTIVGLTEDYDPGSVNPLYALCAAPQVGENGARILRRSRQPYVPDEILFLPMPLKYSCYDKHCDGEDMTCKGGKCVSAVLADPASTLPRFRPDLVDGSGGTCFSAGTCMSTLFPAVVVDPETCTYAVAGSASAPPPIDPAVDPFRPPCTDASACASGVCTDGRCEPLPPGVPWEGVNVAIVYDGGIGREILDQDPDEGFVIPDPAKPQQFRLAEGLCEMVKGKDADGNPTSHRITAVRASGVCQPKSIYQPLCAEDQLAAMGVDEHGVASNPSPGECRAVELEPPPAALMIVVDNTEGHRAFYNVEELKALELPLRDPALRQTDLGLLYTNDASDTCDESRPALVPLDRSEATRQELIDSFLSYSLDPSKLVAGDVSFEGALESAYKLVGEAPGYHRRAVVVLGNRGFDTVTCGGDSPAARALAARTSPPDPSRPIETYVLQLVKRNPDVALADDEPDPGVHALAAAGTPEGKAPDPDARADKRVAKAAFQRIIESLATCVYDVDDAKAPSVDDVLSFTNPLDGATTKIAPNAACTAEEAPGAGWGYASDAPAGKKRVVLCADSCAAYRTVVAAASDFALLYQQPSYPVPMFAHQGDCGTD